MIMRTFIWNIFHPKIKMVSVRVSISDARHKASKVVSYKVSTRHTHRRSS